MLDITRYIKAKEANTVKLIKLGPTVAAVFQKFDQDTSKPTFEEKQEFTIDELSQSVINLNKQKADYDSNMLSQIANTNIAIADAKALGDLAVEDDPGY